MRAPSRPQGLFAVLGLSGAMLMLAASALAGQAFHGTFTVPNEAGGVMSLQITEASGGLVRGTLVSNGVSYDVQGHVEDGTLVGRMSGPEGLLHFTAERWENELWLELYGSDARGQPDYDDYTEIDLVLAGTAGSGTMAPGGFGAGAGATAGGIATGGTGNPLGAAAGPGAGGPDPYVGTFSDGNVTLQLQGGPGAYQGQVSVGGAAYPVQAQAVAEGIQGVIQAPDGQYAIVAQAQGNGLLVASGGMQYSLQRQGVAQRQSTPGGVVTGGPVTGGTAGRAAPGRGAGVRPDAGQAGGRTTTGRPLAPGFTEDHAQVREWVGFLSGKKLTWMSSYSSGSAGGYSARTDVYLCSDRSYAVRDESSVSVDVGGAFGNSGGVGGDQGRWMVITNGQVVGLVLESQTGQVSEYRLDYQNQETYANGERVYVTPAEVCM